MTDQAPIAAAAKRVRNEFGRPDVLIQNSVITTTSDHGHTAEEHSQANRPSIVSLEKMRTVWDTNVFGMLSVCQTMVPLLRNTPNSRIVNVSSGVGSLTLVSDPDSPMRLFFSTTYVASKTALNALTVAMAIELEADGIKVNAVLPSYAKTKMNGFTDPDTLEDSAAEAVRVALLGADGPTGAFTHASMGTIPW